MIADMPPIEASASVSVASTDSPTHTVLPTVLGALWIPTAFGKSQGCCCGFSCHHGVSPFDRCGKCIAEHRAEVAAHVERAVANAHLSLAAAREFGFARLDLATEEARVRNMFPPDDETTVTDAELAAMVAQYERAARV